MNKGDTQQVLDHGYVKFIDSMGTDETVIEAARMSTGKGFEGWGTAETPGDEKLLDYLYRNKHMTPFEMCELAIEVQAPIFVFREWHRHRTMSFNEMSARYTQMPNLHYVPAADRFAPKATGNKQESSVTATSSARDESWQYVVKTEQSKLYVNYGEMLRDGVPKEVARINTPVSRYSRMRAKTDLRNWLGFLNLRMRENAQWEIRQYAAAVAQIIAEIWPRTYALFLNYDLNAVSFSFREIEALRLAVDCKTMDRAVEKFSSPSKSESAVNDFEKKLGWKPLP